MKVVYVCKYRVHVHVHVCAYVVAIVMSPQEYIPLPPPEEGESPSFQYSAVECALFAFHQMVQKVLHHHYIMTKSHDPLLTYCPCTLYLRFLSSYQQKRMQNDSKTLRRGLCACWNTCISTTAFSSLFVCIVRLSCDCHVISQAAVLCSEVPGLPQQSAGGCEECWQCGDQGRAGKEGGRHQPLSFHL